MLLFLGVLFSLVLVTICEEHVYTFWPRDNKDSTTYSDIPKHQPKTNDAFHKMLVKDGDDVHRSRSDIFEKGSTWFWSGTLDTKVFDKKYKDLKMLTAIHDKTQALKDGEDPDNTPSRSALVSLHNNTRQNSKRVKRDLTHQDDAQRALKFISMPASGNNDLNKDGVKYNYDDSAGRGIRLYVIDSGANPDSSEWDLSEGGAPSYIYAEPYTSRVPGDFEVHGSCMLSLAAGQTYGIAKKSQLVAVQVDDVTNKFLELFVWEKSIDALSKVYDDIWDAQGKGHANGGIDNLWDAVVSMSFTLDLTPGTSLFEAFEMRYYQILEELASWGVSLVASGGQDDADDSNRRRCNGRLPCSFGSPDYKFHLENMIVVGSGEINSGDYHEQDPNNRDNWWTIYAPGWDEDAKGIYCASSTGNDAIIGSGASAATALVAGLMAYFKGLGMDGPDARDALVNYAYQRNSNGPKMVWNGVTV